MLSHGVSRRARLCRSHGVHADLSDRSHSYPEAHCEGVPYCPGPVVDGLHWCHSLSKWFSHEDFRKHCVSLLIIFSVCLGDRPFGMSVKVRCDDDAETIRLNECRTSPDFEFLPPRPTSDHWW